MTQEQPQPAEAYKLIEEALQTIASGGEGQFQWSMTKAESRASNALSALPALRPTQPTSVQPDGATVGAPEWFCLWVHQSLGSTSYLKSCARADEIVKKLALPMRELGSGWQPIETAPKDGTKILGYSPYWDVGTIRWQTSQSGISGFWDVSTRFAHSNAITHWMPIPALPTTQIEDGASS